MKFLRLDKKTGSGAPSISSRYAYLVHTDAVAHFPPVNEKGVRLEGSIELKEDCHMIPVYLTNSSQEFSYDIIGDDDEKTYLVKFSGTHPGTELEGLEFSKNMIEQPFLVLLPSCKANEPWKLLGEMTNPLIFTSSHKSAREGSKFNFNFEQRIGSEFIYFSYGGTIVPPPEGGGTDPEIPDGGFDPSKWAKRNADNVEGANVILWREALEIYSKTEIDNLIKAQTVDRILSIGDITATSNTAYLALPPELKNEVIINGDNYSRTVAQQFPFTPVVSDQKILIIEAQPDADVFHLVEGVEAPEAVEPAYTGLFIARLIVSTTGVIVEDENTNFKRKQESDWRYVNITDASAPITLALPYDTRGSFYLTKSPGVGIPTIAGIKKTSIAFAGDQYFYGGREGLIFNATGGDVILNALGVVDNSVFLISNRITPFTLKNNSAVKWKLRESVIELLPSGSDPDLSGYLQKPTTDGIWVVTRTGGVSGYTDASTLGKNISNSNLVWTADRTQNLGTKKLSFTNGRFSVPALELEITAENSVPNKIWTDGIGYYFNNNLGIKKKVALGSVFTYTPTGNFTLSAIKTALEATGMIFNDAHIIINIGSNNYTCSIDIGASNLNTIITIGKRGNGSISFNSTRTLSSGADAITIMNGNEGSMAKIDFGTSTDFLTIRNL